MRMSAVAKKISLLESHFDLKISVLDESIYLITIIVHRISIVSFLLSENILPFRLLIRIFHIQIIIVHYVVVIILANNYQTRDIVVLLVLHGGIGDVRGAVMYV